MLVLHELPLFRGMSVGGAPRSQKGLPRAIPDVLVEKVKTWPGLLKNQNGVSSQTLNCFPTTAMLVLNGIDAPVHEEGGPGSLIIPLVIVVVGAGAVDVLLLVAFVATAPARARRERRRDTIGARRKTDQERQVAMSQAQQDHQGCRRNECENVLKNGCAEKTRQEEGKPKFGKGDIRIMESRPESLEERLD